MDDLDLKDVIERADPDVLNRLLVEYSQRWRHYVSLIWSISGIFIPLSLSGIAVALNDPIRSCFVGMFSIALIWIWYLIARELRLAADQNRWAYAAIESKLLKLNPPLANYGLLELHPTFKKKKIHVRELRKWIAVAITIGWVAAMIVSVINSLI